MIRKFARVACPERDLLDLFADGENWKSWMPGLGRSTLVSRSQNEMVVDIVQEHLGRNHELRIESRFVGSTVRQQQIRGFFKRWQAVWSFSPSPGGSGTTVSCELDIDLGMMGLLAPARVVQGSVDRFFDDTVAGAERALRARERQPSGAGDRGETLLEVFETRTGLEVWVAGRKVACV